MSFNSNNKNLVLKNIGLLALAVFLPLVTFFTRTWESLVVTSLLSSAALAVITASLPVWTTAAVPLAVFGLCLLVGGDLYLAMLPLVLLPAGIATGVCIRKKRTRGFTVGISSFGLIVGGFLGFLIITWAGCGTVNVTAMRLCYNELYRYFTEVMFDSVYVSLKNAFDSYGYEEGYLEAYTASFLKSFRPMFFGTVIFTCNAVAYAFTAVSGRLYKMLDVSKFKSLPGIDGKWEFVLTKSSAVVFTVCYVCLFIGGDSLALPETSAFYAVMLAIVGGVYVMAFRSIRSRSKLTGGVDLIVICIVLFIFFQSSLMDIISLMLVVIGISATFKSNKKGDKHEKA